MNQILIIIGLCFANIVFYLIMNRLKSHKLVELVFLIAFTITTYYILRNIDRNSHDNFFFEVSPARKKCLEEQVEPIFNRTKGCCPKWSTGGIPASRTYTDLIDPNNKLNWNRVDAFGAEDSITPPTQTCDDPSIGY
jgi:hypothetical protein